MGIQRGAPGRIAGEDRSGQRPRVSGYDVAGHVVGAVALALSLALLWLAWMFARPLALLVAAIILANALEPVVEYLMRWMRRTVAIAAIYVGLLVTIVIGGTVILPSTVAQVGEAARNLPRLIERGQQLAAVWVPVTGGLGDAILQPLSSSGASWLASLPLAIVASAFEGVFVVFLSLYWLAAMPTLRTFLLSLIPPDRTREARAILEEIGLTMGGYVRGVLIEALLIGVVVYAGLTLIGVQYAAALAVVAGLGELLPYVGPIIAAIPAVVLALFDSPTQALIVVGFYITLQLVEGHVLYPLVVGNQSEIPPLLIILGLLAGGAIGGILGALVAVPLAGALRIVVLRLVAPAVRDRVGAAQRTPDAPARPSVRAG